MGGNEITGTVIGGTVIGGSPRSPLEGSVVGVVPPSTAPTSPSDGTAGTVVGALPGTVVPAAPGVPAGSSAPAADVAIVVDVGDDGRPDPFVPEGAWAGASSWLGSGLGRSMPRCDTTDDT